jgi:GH35 family endo-1,4-beta-xylanase
MPANNEVIEDVPTTEEIAQHYSAAMDSVDLINEIVASGDTDDESTDTIARNKEHLEIMVAKDFWTTEDLAPFTAAINA